MSITLTRGLLALVGLAALGLGCAGSMGAGQALPTSTPVRLSQPGPAFQSSEFQGLGGGTLHIAPSSGASPLALISWEQKSDSEFIVNVLVEHPPAGNWLLVGDRELGTPDTWLPFGGKVDKSLVLSFDLGGDGETKVTAKAGTGVLEKQRQWVIKTPGKHNRNAKPTAPREFETGEDESRLMMIVGGRPLWFTLLRS